MVSMDEVWAPDKVYEEANRELRGFSVCRENERVKEIR
jgi:hypothetical protein